MICIIFLWPPKLNAFRGVGPRHDTQMIGAKKKDNAINIQNPAADAIYEGNYGNYTLLLKPEMRD